MKTLIDLREKHTSEIIDAIRNLYDEPLKEIRSGKQSITACIGCWNCWVKTPGQCVMKDEMAASYTDYINSDTVILLMDTAHGFISHLAKAFIDRTIPHYLPYIEIVNAGGLELHPLESRNAKNRTVTFGSVEPMEKLVIYNGSPRRSRSNSALILKKSVEVLGDKIEIRDLKEGDIWEEWAEAFKTEKHTMFFMPLYVHAMPSHVMGFMEKLQASEGSISFFIQSGFPESGQSHYLEACLEQLALKLGRTYLGTAIKGGVEGLQTRPVKAQEKIIEPMINAIVHLVCKGNFNPMDIRQLAMPISFGKGAAMVVKLIAKMAGLNAYWNKQLKKNNAYEKRFDCLELSKKQV